MCLFVNVSKQQTPVRHLFSGSKEFLSSGQFGQGHRAQFTALRTRKLSLLQQKAAVIKAKKETFKAKVLRINEEAAIVNVPLLSAEANGAEEMEPQLEAAAALTVKHIVRAHPTGSLTVV